MSDSFTSYVDELAASAREAGVAEERYRKEAAARAAELRDERAFAYRRLHLVRTIGAAVAQAENVEQAVAAGRAAMLREVGWAASTDWQKEVAASFAPVSQAIWTSVSASDHDGTAKDVAGAIQAFEEWYRARRQSPFLALMERETVELPLVEV
jgi:hypothetical protein